MVNTNDRPSQQPEIECFKPLLSVEIWSPPVSGCGVLRELFTPS